MKDFYKFKYLTVKLKTYLIILQQESILSTAKDL